jgi:hypothetical protein
MRVVIPIHSFVDLITNSSTEIFVEANAETVKTVKALVNELLKIAASELKADDLFNFELKTSCDCTEGYTEKDFQEEYEQTFEEHNEDCERRQTKMIVTAKPNVPHLKKAVEILNNLENLFETREYSN